MTTDLNAKTARLINRFYQDRLRFSRGYGGGGPIKYFYLNRVRQGTDHVFQSHIVLLYGVKKTQENVVCPLPWVTTEAGKDQFLSINGFTVAGSLSAEELSGRTFRLDSDSEGLDPHGFRAAGELMESALGDSVIDPYMFEYVTLTFGAFDGRQIYVEIEASVFDSRRSGISVFGKLRPEVKSA